MTKTTELSYFDYQNAVKSLKVALELTKDELDRDGAIQRFEFTIELSWKILQRILVDRKILVHSPRSTYREAYKEGLVKDVEVWLTYWDVRKQTTHIYKKEIAEEIFRKLPGFLKIAEELVKALRVEFD